MKYMGSKRHMLKNGLGELICEQSRYYRRIVDLFCGAGSVAWFAAEKTPLPVMAVDLQSYAVVLANAVVGRSRPLDAERLVDTWLEKVRKARMKSRKWETALSLQEDSLDTCKLVYEARRICEEPLTTGPVWNAYGGYYYSPSQALTFDYMLKYLPIKEPQRSVCLAATIWAASRCAAAPGHTAQPFRPTEKSKVFILDAWCCDPLILCENSLRQICAIHANTTGEALVSDALDVAPRLNSDDLVIVDPPYSGVHYSRFYHVLETIARGHCGDITGKGRYPPIEERPSSSFSKKSLSRIALENLLVSLARVRATVIVTFPIGECTNGLSGDIVVETACLLYDVQKQVINGHFSTLGGNNSHRAARKSSAELLLLLRPR